MWEQFSQQGSDESVILNEDSGRFSAVTHEMTEKLMRMDLTSREHRLVWFFIREIQGYGLKEKIIKTAKIIQSTGLHKQHLNTALRSLMSKGLIERAEIDAGLPGQYLYSFNEKLFERVHATKVVKETYIEDGKVIHIQNFKAPSQLPGGNRISYQGVTELVTTKPRKAATSAAERGFKEILKKDKEILRRGIEESFTFKLKSEEELIAESKAKFEMQRRQLGF